MGYEMKFIIGIKQRATNSLEHQGYVYCQKIAVYDYCKDDKLADFTDEFPDSNCFVFMRNEDKEEITDKYGDPFKEIDLDKLIEYLEADTDDYRRKLPFLSLLKGFQENKNRFESDISELVILRYGY